MLSFYRSALTLLLLTAAAGATFSGELATPSGDLERVDAHRTLGPPTQFQNLTVWPVLTETPIATGKYLSLHEAQATCGVRVREKTTRDGRRGDGATVDELVIENSCDRPLLVTAGTLLKGGKQDRQLGQDLVVAANATVPAEAFCVERGRWSGQRDGRATGGDFEIPRVKAAKRLRAAAQYDKDQGEVWRQVDTVNAKTEKAPATSTFLATVEEDDPTARDVRRKMKAAVRAHFDDLAGEGVVGFAYAVNGEPLGMRTFANRRLLSAHFEPFLETMSLEAQVAQFRDRSAGRATFDEPASSEALLKMVRGIDAARLEVVKTAGLNQNQVRRNDWGGHSSCRIRSEAEDGRWLSLTDDWTAPAEYSDEVRDEMIKLRALGYTSH